MKKAEPITGSLGKPAPVTDIQVENIPGGAIISYKIPNVEDILGVKGVYQITTGATYGFFLVLREQVDIGIQRYAGT